MPDSGIYLSNDRLRQLHGDLFEQDSRGVIADEWQRQATQALPDLVAQAQQEEAQRQAAAEQQRQQAEQDQRNALADQFTASVQADPALAAHLGGGPAPQESPQPAPTDAMTAPVAPAVPTTPDAAPAPPVAATPPAPDAPVTAPMSPASGWETVARAAAQKYGIDPDIFSRQIGQESGFNPAARSPAGAIGIAQFMPATAQGMGIDPTDPQQALDGAARLMASHLQTYGGDYGKALAAYNAGPGNVDKYGGVPPFAETQRYVSTILGGAGQAIANSGAGRVITAAVNNVVGALRPSQFGVGLSDAEAYAACGPVAAMAFARATGQNPTAEQAVALAKQVGWSPAQGMAGPGSELDLLKHMGVPAHMENGADPSKIAQDVQNGNPVIISTPGHYFVADGYDPNTGSFHVGSSGTDLRAGSEWMSLDQMQKVMGAAQATLYLDRQPGDGPSYASQQQQTADYSVRNTPAAADQTTASTSAPQGILDKLQQIGPTIGSAISDAFSNLFGSVTGNGGTAANQLPGQSGAPMYSQTASTGLPPAPAGGAPDLGQGLADTFGGAAGRITAGLDPNAPGNQAIGSFLNAPVPGTQTMLAAGTRQIEADMGGPPMTPAEQYAQARGLATGLTQALVPEDLVARAATSGAGSLARSAEQAGTFARDTSGELRFPGENPFALHTEPGPGRVPLGEDDIASHIESLSAQYEANDARIQELENRLSGGMLKSGASGIDRPPWAVGINNEALRQIAEDHGYSAETPGWWQKAGLFSGSGEVRENVGQGGYTGLGRTQQTPAQARAELARLIAENDQIMAATEVPEGATTLYRPAAQTAEDLPWTPYTPPAEVATSAPTGIPAQAISAGTDQGGAGASQAFAPGSAGTASAPATSPLSLTPISAATAPPPAVPSAFTSVAVNGAPSLISRGNPLALKPIGAVSEAANSLLAPLRNTPPQVQTVIRDFVGQMAEARGQADTLALRTKALLGPDDSREAAKLFEKTGDFVPNPTVEQSQHATDVAQFMQDTGDAGRQAGYIKGDVTAGGPGAPQFYFPHSYESGPTIPGSAAPSGISSKGGLNPRGSYSKARTFGTLEEAQANGYQPVDSVSEPLRQYAANVLQSQAKAQVVARIKAIAPDAVIDYTPGARLPEGYTSGASIDPQLGSVALQEPIATALGNIINRGGGNAAGKAIMEAMGTAKEVMLSLSPFHLVTELRQAYRANNPQDAVPIIGKALWNMWSPHYDTFRLANADLYEQAMRAGVTQLEHAALSPDVGERLTGPAAMAVRGGTSAIFGGTGAYSETKREGGTDQQALQNALVSGTVLGAAGAVLAKPMADSLFTRVIPTMKALTWGLKTAGGADPQAAATFVNQTFGGQNLQMIARDPGFQQWLRIGMLAPDWWEGWARQVGGAFNKGDVGTMSRGYWARTLAEAGFALEGLNYALTGHFTNDNGPNHQLDLETTPLTGAKDPQTGVLDRTYGDILGALKNIAQLAASPLEQGGPAQQAGTFVHNKLGLIPSTAVTLMQNQDPSTHQAIVPPGTPAWKAAADVLESTLSRLSPITAAQTMRTNAEQGPGAAAVSAGLGLRLSAQSPDQEIANQKFQEKQARAEALQTNPPAPIREDVGRLYADHGIAILPPAATVPLGGRTAINVPITPAEQVQQRQFLNEALNRNVTQLLQDPSFTSAPRAAQERGLKTALSAAEREARGRLLDSIPSADLNQRADQASGSKQAPRAPIPASRIKP